MFSALLTAYPNLKDLGLNLPGTKILGCPFGSAQFCTQEAASIANEIISMTGTTEDLTDGGIHFQINKFCIPSKFQYVQRCLPPALLLGAASRIDMAVQSTILHYGGWPIPDDPL